MRLLTFQGARGPVYLVTSVLNEKDLMLKQATEMYSLRWALNLIFQAQSKDKSHAPIFWTSIESAKRHLSERQDT
jgi:hypothetical protein